MLSVTKATGRRLALVARTCPGCGSVDVYWGTLKITPSPISLVAETTKSKQLVLLAPLTSTTAPATVRTVVVTSGKLVAIEGLAVSAK